MNKTSEMAARAEQQYRTDRAASPYNERYGDDERRTVPVSSATPWVGWVGFAGVLMVLSGIFQIIAGLVGIFSDTFYLVSDSSSSLLVIQDVQAWGWAHLLIGLVVLFAGISLFRGSTWARMLAVVLAGLAAIAHLLSMPLYPLWSIINITLLVLVMYAVIVHGGELRRD